MNTATLIADVYRQIQQLQQSLSEYEYLKEYLESGQQLQTLFNDALKSASKNQLSAKLQEISNFIDKLQSFEIQSKELVLLSQNSSIKDSLHQIQERLLALQHSTSE